MKVYFNKNLINSALQLLPRSDRTKLYIVVALQILLSLMDLIGVAIIGAIGALAVTGVQSRNPTGKVAQLLEFLNLEGTTLQFQVGILGVLPQPSYCSELYSLLCFRERFSFFFLVEAQA